MLALQEQMAVKRTLFHWIFVLRFANGASLHHFSVFTGMTVFLSDTTHAENTQIWHHCSMQEGPTREQDSSSKIGSGMTIAAWIVVLVIATMYFDRFLDQQHNPNDTVQTTETSGVKVISLQRNRQGHYVTSGKINGTRVRFLLDTGATDVSIPERIANGLQLQRGPEFEVITANGTIPVTMTLLNRVQIGNIIINDVRASINPYMDEDEILLGMTFLKHLEFTQRGDQLILKQYN